MNDRNAPTLDASSGLAAGLGKLVPGFDFLQSLAKGASGALPQIPGFTNWIAPTMDVAEIQKRIDDLKAVQFWLDQNGKALAATVQALEVQRMSLATLKSMNVAVGELGNALGAAAGKGSGNAAPATGSAGRAGRTPAPAAAAMLPGMIDPMQWWGALTQQFQQIAADTMTGAGASGMKGAAKSMTENATRAAQTLTRGSGRAATDSILAAGQAATRTAVQAGTNAARSATRAATASAGRAATRALGGSVRNPLAEAMAGNMAGAVTDAMTGALSTAAKQAMSGGMAGATRGARAAGGAAGDAMSRAAGAAMRQMMAPAQAMLEAGASVASRGLAPKTAAAPPTAAKKRGTGASSRGAGGKKTASRTPQSSAPRKRTAR